MKKLIEKIRFGIAIGCFAFVAMLFIASPIAGGANAFIGQRTGEEWLQVAACFIFIALGFSIPSLVYEKENLAVSLKIVFHMTAGTVVYLLTAYFAGWIETSFPAVAVYLLIAVGAAAVFWGVFMIAFRIQADRINKKIRERE